MDGVFYPEVDSDADGVIDYQDNCPDTSQGEMVDANGCSESDLAGSLAGQCTCPDGSIGQMVGPADDDGVDDGCLCATSEDDSLPPISLIPALISIGLLAIFRRK